jgi:aspartyl-tRNA synthetase
MYRTHTCGELNISKTGTKVTLSGWVHRSREFGGMTFIDLRDRYGLTQLVFNMDTDADICKQARELGREFVIQVTGTVTERSNKNPKIPTGEIEITVEKLRILSKSITPPFTLEEKSDGGDDLRMKFRYLDLRREVVRKNLELRHKMAQETRKYLSSLNFLEIETPVLVNSTPEGARDFVVPSRMNPGEFYALPQSPQTLKQLLMVAGMDRYFQIVKCFRDEDLRADRQPEFTQIDCEMAFVDREDILETFAGLISHLFKEVKGVDFEQNIPRMTFQDAMERFGCDKPDIRFAMEISELTSIVKGKDFKVFDSAAYVGAICAGGCAEYTRKQIDELTAFVQKPQIGAKGLIYAKVNEDGTLKSSVDKFYSSDELKTWAVKTGAKPGDMIFVMAGDKKQTLNALNELRLEMGTRLGLRDKNVFRPLWVIDFPLLEWDEDTKRFYAMHHPFTSPMEEDMEYFTTDPGKVRAKAYDMVINGVEVGGGSIRIHDSEIQKLMFKNLGMGEEEVKRKFSFIMDAFRYGAPPHGGIAFGFDRLAAMFAGLDSIRDVIAFPKNNAGKDVMLDTPGPIAQEQLDELFLVLKKK